MKSDIIISGVGGQGILSIATIIGISALENNLCLKQAEVHGMSQRGGAVQSHLRISDKEIPSDLIPKGEADLILSVEPMESLRYLPFLKPGGWLVTNIQPYVNIQDYPPMDMILDEIKKIKNHIAIDADQIAHDLGSARSSNIVILGASCQFLNLPEELLFSGIKKIFSSKGQSVVDLNINAFLKGKKAGEIYLSSQVIK
jgi:indolepyruvate ferredoxin oxidoreductase, beta subunit